MMRTHNGFIVSGVVAVGLLAACSSDRNAVSLDRPNFTTCVDKKEECPGGQAFRMTGGGRIDTDESVYPPSKNTPESHDFATFGFQARPNGPNTTDGSGHVTWVDHNPFGLGGGFTLHGNVTFFSVTGDHTGRGDACATFGGTATLNTRLAGTFSGVDFQVEHACDHSEPGVGNDHIRLIIPGFYDRAGFLTGGNIQAHRLTGNGA